MSVTGLVSPAVGLSFDEESIENVFRNLNALHKVNIDRNGKYFNLMIDTLNYLDGNYEASMDNPADWYLHKYGVFDHKANRLIRRTICEYKKIRPKTELSQELESALVERVKILCNYSNISLSYDPLINRVM